LLKADCLNMTEDEIEDALKELRDSFSIEGFSFESSARNEKLRAEDVTYEFLQNANYEFLGATRVPFVNIDKNNNLIAFA